MFTLQLNQNKHPYVYFFQNGLDIRNQDQSLANDEENGKDGVSNEVLEMKRIFKEKESKLVSELQDAKDQAELLEFRVLELEEEQEKVLYIKENM